MTQATVKQPREGRTVAVVGDVYRFLATGADDRVVRPANTARLAGKIRETGGLTEEIVYPRIGHMSILGAIAAPLRFLAPVRDDTCDFLGLTAASALKTTDRGTPGQANAQ